MSEAISLILSVSIALSCLFGPVLFHALKAKKKRIKEIEAIARMDAAAVEIALGRKIPAEEEILAETEVSPSVFLHPPIEIDGYKAVGKIEDIEHPGTVVAIIVKTIDGVAIRDSTTGRIEEKFPSIQHLILNEERA